jgi:malonyl-CoA decarboxylase
MPPRRFLDRFRRRGRGRTAPVSLDVSPALTPRDEVHVRELVSDLLGRHGAMTRQAEAAAVADAYLTLTDDGRHRFLLLLAREFWSDPGAVDKAIAAVADVSDDPAKRRTAEGALRDALTPPALHVLRLFTALDGGVRLLVEMRSDLLRLADDEPELFDLDRELREHLATLFDVGLLSLRSITWDAPASLLEKLIAYEAVHAIDSWADLKNRLDSDRRCYAFFHPAMPDEPLVFVEVALTSGIVTEMPALLDEAAPDLELERADTAIFYSISNCQPGLAGVNLGNALIKQVVERLTVELPRINRFVTLSPIPEFRRWVETELRAGTLNERERELLPAEPERVIARLSDEDWSSDEAIRPALVAMCARYLATERDGRALDPVANFHLSNGAAIERVNWLADPSPAGRARSAGIMASYRYDPDHIAERAEAYATRGEVALSAEVRELLAE